MLRDVDTREVTLHISAVSRLVNLALCIVAMWRCVSVYFRSLYFFAVCFAAIDNGNVNFSSFQDLEAWAQQLCNSSHSMSPLINKILANKISANKISS